MKKQLFTLLVSLCGLGAFAQVGINTTDPQAVLDIESDENGILIPRVILTAANIAAPVVNPAGGALEVSTLVYNTATAGTPPNNVVPGFYYWNGTLWVPIGGGSGNSEFQRFGTIVRNTTDTDGDHFLFGSTSLDDITGTADNSRMFFNKTKGAFRAGYAQGMQWNDTNVGNYSFAFGNGTTASGENATAFGGGTTASGLRATAFGRNTIASAEDATAWGWETTAQGTHATAWGISSTAQGNTSTSFGDSNMASGAESTAFGLNTTASGLQSTSFGDNTAASGDRATAWGISTTASGGSATAFGSNTSATRLNSTAFGSLSHATGNYATAWGVGNTAASSTETVLGLYALNPGGNPNNVIATDRLFAIGNGTNNLNRSDAFSILKSGLTRLPATDNAMIDAADGKAVVTKEWVQANTGSGSGEFESIGGIVQNTTDTANDHFVFGSTSLDNLAGGDDDSRMFFNKTKGAFRAGYADDAQWNDANVGIYSVAFGDMNTASGGTSTAFGASNFATGHYSTAFGGANNANGNYSTAFGNINTASGSTSAAFGMQNTALGDYSAAWGFNNTAGSYAETVLGRFADNTAGNPNNWTAADRLFAIGNGTDGANRRNALTLFKNGNFVVGSSQLDDITGETHDNNRMFFNKETGAFRAGRAGGSYWNDANVGYYSVAIGLNNTASGYASTAFGFGNDASGSYSTAFGEDNTASGYWATVFGMQNTAASIYETVLGSYADNAGGNPTAWVATDRLFAIGNGMNNGNRSTALVILKNGLTRLPATTIAMITAADGKAVVTKEYLQANRGWALEGNAGTNANTHFIGTTDNIDLVFRRNDIQAGRIGLNQTAFGTNSLLNAVGGDSNSAYGSNTLQDNTTGSNNTAIGFSALSTNIANLGSTAIGYEAMRYADSRTTGRITFNTAVGYQALHGSNTPANNTGRWNTAVGDQALFRNTSGEANVAIGALALNLNTSGNNNTAIGVDVLRRNVNGHSNTAVGNQALENNTSGIQNIAMGADALYTNSTGNANTATGHSALYSNTTAQWNTAVGIGALYSNNGAAANSNTAVGVDALRANTTGASNTAIGRRAFYTGAAYSNSTALGNDAQIGASNTVRIGNGAITQIYAQVGVTATSDKRFKKDIQNNVPGLEFITKLNPVTYRFDARKQEAFIHKNSDYNPAENNYPEKYDIEKITFSGFLAQDVEQAARSIGYDFSGVDIPKNDNSHYGLRYSEFVVPLVKAVQELKAENDELKEEIRQLKGVENKEMEALKVRLERLEKLLLEKE